MGDQVTMITLGIRGDQPADPEQPTLVDGIHLRWMPDPDVGFPWYGFYLFRRESAPPRLCLAAELGDVTPATPASLSVVTNLGRLSSPKALVFTDDFAPKGTVEVDLGAPLRFDLPDGVEAGQVEVRIGSRTPPVTPAAETAVDFRNWPPGDRPNPVVEQGARFEVRNPVTPPPPIARFVQASVQPWTGLRALSQIEIQLPCATAGIVLLLSRATNNERLRVQAFNQDGTLAQQLDVTVTGRPTREVTLHGTAITRVLIDAPLAEALLHRIAWQCISVVQDALVEVQVLAGKTVVTQTVVHAGPGQIVAGSLVGKGITTVEINTATAAAALVDLCFQLTRRPANFGWSEVKGFPYPLCLPVADPDYPCPGRPADTIAARALALSRVTYPAPTGWDQGFAPLHDELVALVHGGPAAGAMAVRTHPTVPGQPLSPSADREVPTLPGVRPLELLLLASLHPAMAQMLGLYFVDGSALPGVGYDYLLVGDPAGILGGSVKSALEWMAVETDPSKVWIELITDQHVNTRPPIASPGPPRAYALPGTASRAIDGAVAPEMAGNVGLWWPLPADPADGQPEPDRIVFYYPKRADLGIVEPTAQPALVQYQSLPGLPPVLVSEPDPSAPPADPGSRSSDWPPPSITFHVVDGSLPEGWYSYRLSGQDLFGRRSPLGPPAEWYQWDPSPGTPAPWYYKAPAGHRSIHTFAVALLDKIPPPAPLAVEAWALDPLDRWLLADAPYEAWRAGVAPDLVGLRVRWRWTLMQQLQAPDTREFRVYYQPGRWNARLATIATVTAATPVESDVDLDVADTHAAGAFTGARLRVGNDDFAIVGSQPGAQLRLRVKNIGAHDEVRPAEGKPCTVAIPETHALWIDTSRATSWAQRLAVVPYDPSARTVVEPSIDGNGIRLSDAAFAEAQLSVQVTVAGAVVQLPAAADLSGVQPWIDHVRLEDAGGAHDMRRVVGYDVAARTVTLESAPTIGTPVAWILGRPAREYDLFLPAPDVGAGQPFEPSLVEPTVYAQIAVSATDDKTHTLDDPKWNASPLGHRSGNEGPASPSAAIFRVLQTPPPAPELPDLPERLVATAPDYHNRSYTTVRFKPVDHLKVHILRALDDTLFQRDWLIRETRKALDPAKPEHADCFPDGWAPARAQTAAAALKAITAEAHYNSLPSDAWDVLALLPGNEGAAGGKPILQNAALKSRDWLVRRTRAALAATDAGLFPKSWNQTTRTDAAAALDQLTDSAGYAALSDGALRVLGGLPGNETPYVQVTLQALNMAAAEIQDERRPDDPAGYAPDPALRAYTDTLPGRARNRYFYRAVFVDGAQNASGLSNAGPPVYLPAVDPPRAPVITKVVGGDRQITIEWAPNREPQLAAYRVYRTDTRESARDPRLMTLAVTATAADREWVDTAVQPGVAMYYRLVTVDSAGNASAPSTTVSQRAFDDSRPTPPVWGLPALDPDNNSVILSWTPGSAHVQALLLRRTSVTAWEEMTGWLPAGTTSVTDRRAASGVYTYRLKVMDSAGRVATAEQDLQV
jgi:hypothetical protein